MQDVAALLASMGENPLAAAAVSRPEALFVLTRAVIGVVRAAHEERPDQFAPQALEDELCRLVRFYLRPAG